MAQSREPQVTLAALQAAEALLYAQRYRDACTAFAQLAGTDGHRAEANRGWSRALSALDNFEEAAARCEVAIQADPSDEATYTWLQTVCADLLDSKALISRIQQHVDRVKSASAHAAWGNFLAAVERPESAIAEYAKAAEGNAPGARTLQSWGNALAALGRHEEALDRYACAIQSIAADNEMDEELFGSIFTSLSALETPDSGIARIQEIVDRAGGLDTRLRWASTLYAIDRAAEGAAEYGKAMRTPADELAAWRSWGQALVHLGRYDEAMQKYEKVIDIAPTDQAAYVDAEAAISKLESADASIAKLQEIVDRTPSAIANDCFATMLFRLNKSDLALTRFEAAARLSLDEVSFSVWAEALQALGRPTEAASKLVAAISREPYGQGRIRRRLVRILNSLRPLEAALPALQDEVDEIDAVAVYAGWGHVLAELGEPTAALEQYAKAALKDPDDSEFHVFSGRILANLGRHKEALAQFVIAAEKKLYSEDLFTRIHDSLSHADPESKQSIISIVQSCVDDSRQSTAHLHWGQTLSKLTHHSAATEQHERAVELDSEDSNLRVALGLALYREKKFARAADCYCRAVSLSSGEKASLSAALEGMKDVLTRLDNDRHAAVIGEAINAIDGAYAYRAWALVLGSVGRPGGELEHFAKAIEKHPTNYTLRAEYAYRLVNAGQTEIGLAQYRVAAEGQQASPFIQRLWGWSLGQMRLFQEATEKFEQATELEEGAGRSDGDTHFDWALVLDSMGCYEASIEKYRECMRLNETPISVAFCLHNIANIRERQGDYANASEVWDQALAAYTKAVSQTPDKSDVFLYYGSVCHDVKGDFEAAATHYAVALGLQPNNSVVLAAIARLNLQRMEFLRYDRRHAERVTEYHWAAWEAYGRAKRVLMRRLENLKTASTLIELGQLHLGMSETESAQDCFTKALEIDKESAEAAALLCKTHLRKEDFRNALNCAKTAVARDSQSLAYRASLAEVHHKLGVLDQAETEYRKVLAVAPCHVDALVGLGNTYVSMAEEFQKVGKSSDAENMFSLALDQFSLSLAAATGKGSRQLSPVERAALSYSRGYSNVMRYEAQTLVNRDEKLLDAARSAFDEVPPRDPNYHKAQRAKLKIKERTQASARSARWGAWIIVLGAFTTFLIANVTFLFGKPGLVKSFQVTDQSVQFLKVAKVPDDVVAKLEMLVKQGAAPQATFDIELKSALGEELTRKFGALIREQAVTGSMVRLQESLDTGYYALLSFGALMFMVTGLYLQQLSKLKFGGIELEKTSEATTKVSGSLGIPK